MPVVVPPVVVSAVVVVVVPGSPEVSLELDEVSSAPTVVPPVVVVPLVGPAVVPPVVVVPLALASLEPVSSGVPVVVGAGPVVGEGVPLVVVPGVLVDVSVSPPPSPLHAISEGPSVESSQKYRVGRMFAGYQTRGHTTAREMIPRPRDRSSSADLRFVYDRRRMTVADASALAEALMARAPTPHSRWLAEPDEPALQDLLRARYGETYAYRDLYGRGGLARRWHMRDLLSLGEYDDDGALVSHTGILLHPGRDYAESGLSLIHPRRRSAMTRHEHAAMWQYVLGTLADHVSHLHQHTSTLHPRAQRYARHYMRAVPIGLVVDYTTGERLIGIDSSDAPMQALAMTTPLRPVVRAAPRHLPDGPWFAWLQAIFARLGGPPAIPVAPDDRGDDLTIGTSDWNSALQLARRVVVGLGDPSEPPQIAARPGHVPARVSLVHLPVTDPALVARGSGVLLRAGHVPVGVRPGGAADGDDDEIVWQHLPDRAAARASAARAVLAPGENSDLFRGWIELCAPTS